MVLVVYGLIHFEPLQWQVLRFIWLIIIDLFVSKLASSLNMESINIWFTSCCTQYK